ncbi:xanthine dehydrogenase small subunit [Halomonas koreensis]|uniref:Xanthine dehydrogenase small subunit n=1 Tax=Halomonas koreensis TaxID=245385 RepID=A0ABU1FXB8_9GAMM|nr:xanthine dehydrogenase small subunit [Halomonas koreensis]MDR5865330.1 xanthine dehydrogenase small subunit [Halomonas koreensis]
MAQHHPPPPARADAIRFLLNGEPMAVGGIAPTRTVLQLLREDLRLTGTKEGCAEGDCGACTVVLAEPDGMGLKAQAVNACIRFAPTLDGKALFTVEHLRQADGGLHPVQQAMVDHHGSQCGFCTPGFVMSLWGQYIAHQGEGARPSRRALGDALTGNLCRCTGYRPILDAAEAMFDLPVVAFDHEAVRAGLVPLQRHESWVYEADGARFFVPRTLEALVELRAAHPRATILAGGTDVGLWVTKDLRDLGDILYVGDVAELHAIEEHDDGLRIGAGASLTAAYAALIRHYPEAAEMGERFASVPIRNAGTLGGNVANGSPIGDSMPWLIAVGARVALRSREGSRCLPLEDLYLGYMKQALQDDEIVEAVEVPRPPADQRFRTYKVAKRFDSDISGICAAFAIRLDRGRIASARVAFGGMAATPARAAKCEAALSGQSWTEATARAAMAALAEDYSPLTDMRATEAYRLQTAQNLLYRFHLETREDDPLPASRVSVFAEPGEEPL